MRKRLGLGLQGVKADVLGTIEKARGSTDGRGEDGGAHIDNVGPAAQDSSSTAFGGLLPAAAAPGQLQDKVPVRRSCAACSSFAKGEETNWAEGLVHVRMAKLMNPCRAWRLLLGNI